VQARRKPGQKTGKLSAEQGEIARLRRQFEKSTSVVSCDAPTS
jgi:hypothetical protein